MPASPRTALVLGGGGIVGGAWMVGALAAIATETGWEPGTADYILGTSAGSVIGALLASGLTGRQLLAYARADDPAAGADHFGTSVRLHWSFPRPLLGSPRLVLRSLREPWRYNAAGIIGLLPTGVVSTEPVKAIVRRRVASGWSRHPNLWIVAVDYENGDRVVFGRRGAPPTDLAEAVAASCAIPGYFHPETIAGDRFVDGGLYSPSNLDLLLDTDAEVVVCLNPMTSRHRGRGLSPSGAIASFIRGTQRGSLEREAQALRRAGKQVILIEPRAEDLRVMGLNYMSSGRRHQVLELALRTTSQTLSGRGPGRLLGALTAPVHRASRTA